MNVNRRGFLISSMGAAALCSLSPVLLADGKVARQGGSRYRLGLNAYSFDKPLRDGSMTWDDVVQFCAQAGIDALDATGYYFPGYPKVPSDESIYRLERTAFVNGVAISGPGVRIDFAVTDATSRKLDVKLLMTWIEVSSRL